MTWLLKIKRRAQNAAVRWLDFGVEPKHRRPSGDLLLDHSNDDDLADWPGAIADGDEPWESAALTDTERREVEAVTERTIAWLRGIREES